jgi:hypothetical protein
MDLRTIGEVRIDAWSSTGENGSIKRGEEHEETD